MRVFGLGQVNDLGDLHFRLARAGHDVRVWIEDAGSADVFEGLLPRIASREAGVEWVAQAGPEGLILVEGTGYGDFQDSLRERGLRVIGGSALGDKLELDRAFGQRVLRDAGLPVAPSHEVLGFGEAVAFVERYPRRYVLKYAGGEYSSTRTVIGALDSGADMLAALRMQQRGWTEKDPPQLVLMEHLRGVEVGVGAFFNGRDFVGPPNLDWEHKRFFPGDLGELTCEMGTVVSYRQAERLFDATLRRVGPMLSRSNYVGYVNLNMIVNDGGTFPLEFTCRFGIPGYAILSALYKEPWDAILTRLVAKEGTPIATYDGFAVGIVLTVPPFPYEDGYARLSKGAALTFAPDLNEEDAEHLHYGEVRRDGDQLVTAGQVGYVVVVTGRGLTIEAARYDAYVRARKVLVPNVRYRLDIGERLEKQDWAELARLGWVQ